MVFLIINGFDSLDFILSYNEFGQMLIDEAYSELFTFGYDGGCRLYDWEAYSFPYCMFSDGVGVSVFPM